LRKKFPIESRLANCRKFFISADHIILIADGSSYRIITINRRPNAFAEKKSAFAY